MRPTARSTRWPVRWACEAPPTWPGLPVIALAAGAVTLAVTPLANALSRAHERRADRFAIDLTRNAAAFMSAIRRLSAQNLAEETAAGVGRGDLPLAPVHGTPPRAPRRRWVERAT